MGLKKAGYSRLFFMMKTKTKDKLRDYLWATGRQSLSQYIENALLNQMMRDGIIRSDEKKCND